MTEENRDEKKNKRCSYEIETIADDYIWNVLIDAKFQRIEGIFGFKHLEIIDNYREYVALNQGLCPGEITRGINEIDLAIRLYNMRNAKGNRN